MNSTDNSEQQVIDLDRARSRVAGDEDMLRELAQIFLDESAQWLKRIEKAVADADGEALFRAAHDIKGSTEVFGADSAVSTAKTLERMGRDDALEDADETLGALKAEMVWVRQALEQYLDNS